MLSVASADLTAPQTHEDAILKDRTALVLYGTETGNAQDVADEIGRLTTRLHFATVVLDLDSVDIRDLIKHSIVIIAISTTGQGEFPQNARAFWKTLLSNRLRPGILRRMCFSTFGLGDSSYPRYNVAHRMLFGRLLQLGAQLMCPRGEGNEQHPEGHSADFRTWIVDLRASIEKHFPLSPGISIISDETFVEPHWRLEQVTAQHGMDGVSTTSVSAEVPDESLVPICESVKADLIANERLTPVDHFQDVRLLDLSLHADVPYGPGAVAVVYPKNFPADVDDFIKSQSWESVADLPLALCPTSVNTPTPASSPSPLRHVTLAPTTTLRELLTNYLDIASIPRRSFFASLAYFTKCGNEDEKYQRERILELANPELIDELWDYTTRPRRTILEVMPEFPSVKIPWQYACTVLPIMRGRQFSIASGGDLASSTGRKGASRVQLLVAVANPPNPIIKYRKRHGVCTRYITTLKPGQQLNIGMQPGYLDVKPSDYEVPMIMISPGTGLASMRSLIYDRLKCARQGMFKVAGQPLAGCLLFFGCRSRDADLFFRHEWGALEREGLEMFLALSRDKEEPRNYVQDLLVKQADKVFEAIDAKQARIFVCGSSGSMPKAVRQAIVDIVKSKRDMNDEDAEAYLAALEKQGRYKQEIW